MLAKLFSDCVISSHDDPSPALTLSQNQGFIGSLYTEMSLGVAPKIFNRIAALKLCPKVEKAENAGSVVSVYITVPQGFRDH